jgi:hypothetical protein
MDRATERTQLEVRRRPVTADVLASCADGVRAMHAYWQEKRGNRPMPSRNDIDPAEIARYLPSICVVEVLPDPPYLRYRLVGTRQVLIRGHDPTGQAVAGHHIARDVEGMEDLVLGNYKATIESRAPIYADREINGPDLPVTSFSPRSLKITASLFLPCSSDGRNVDVIIAYSELVDSR